MPERQGGRVVNFHRRTSRNPRAENKLGAFYLSGQGVVADDSLAAAWFTKAAEQDNPDAQANLAHLYEAGRGVARDLKVAYMWGLLSLRGSGAEQSAELRDLADTMSKSDIADAERRTSEWLSAHITSQPQRLGLPRRVALQ